MKAVLVEKPFSVRIAEVPTPKVTHADDVLIKVLYGGICGSDIGIYAGTNSLATYPRIIGHEFGGRVVEIGPGVTNVKVGDVVAIDPVRACGHCYACRHGRHNVCSTVEVTGVHRDGGFSEYALAPAYAAYKIDAEKIPLSYLSLVEPYSIGVQVNHRGEITADDKVLVMGSGPIGVCVMQVAKARGAQVMMTDLVDARLQRALAMGADRVVNVKNEDLRAAVMAFTDNEGMPVVVDTVCSLTSVPEAMDLACPAGRVVVLGLKDKPSEIAAVGFTKKELNVVGSRLNNYRFPEVIELFESGKVNPEKLSTNTFAFTEVEEAIKLNREHPEAVCKITLDFQ